MSTYPTITAVVPLYNGAQYIEAALSSIHDQSVSVSEVLVIDDGSTDAGPDLARAHPVRPKVIMQENKGPSAARNHGIKLAASQFVAFLDQDDIWRPEKLSLQCHAFANDPELMVCFGRFNYFWDDPTSAEAGAFRDHPRANAAPGYVTTTMLARRSVFDILGYYDETLAHADSIKWCAALRDRCVPHKMLDVVVLEHRMHNTNLTRRQRETGTAEILQVLHQRGLAARIAVEG